MTWSGIARAARWPLWSWRNLAVTSIAALVLLAALGRLTDGLGAADASPTKTPMTPAGPTVPVPSPDTATPPTTGPASSLTPPTSAAPTATPAKDSPVRVATLFVTAWTKTGNGDQAWMAGMKPWATDKLIASMSGTDPAQVPATKVTGDAALTRTQAGAATVSVPTDGGRIAVQLLQQGGTWKANTLAPDDAPPGAPTPALGRTATGSGT